MKQIKIFLAFTFFMASICGTNSGAGAQNKTASEIGLAGSTPGDGLIKSLLKIPAATLVEFIRWDLSLQTKEPNQNSFALNLQFGESQPNTMGFKGDGEKRSVAGTFTVLQKGKQIIYQLKSSQFSSVISLVKLNDNIFHILTPLNRLMVGNGGYSYTLNRKIPVTTTNGLPSWALSFAMLSDTSRQLIYDGRTPCQELATDFGLKASPECFKSKWRIILNKDPKTQQPTTYSIRKVIDSVPRNLTGKWKAVKGIPGNPNVLLYQLDPDKPEKTISLLVGDENVLFFLNKKQQLYAGNSDFSFTLNKKLK